MAKNAGYDSARFAEHKKLYITTLENQFLTSKFFRQIFR